jgi:hypothetical protein
MIGSLQWAFSLGRFDIQAVTMTMSRFRKAKGHHIYGYLRQFKSAATRVCVDKPDFSTRPIQEFDWVQNIYGKVQEEIPKDIPEPHGKTVVYIHYVDANLYHDIITGRSVTGILHDCNQPLIELFSKRQACVQTATFGSESVAARIAGDQIVDLRNTLRYIGVPVKERSFLFGDNQALVTNSVIPHSTLSKPHNALSYHRVCKAIAACMVNFFWIDGKSNLADIVSKHWAYPQVWHMLQPILFYSGKNKQLLKDSDPDSKTPSKEEKKTDENGLVTNESIRVVARGGDGNFQKKCMQQFSEHPPPLNVGKHTDQFSCLNRW